MHKQLSIVLTFLILMTSLGSAQDKAKRPSPPAQAQCKFSDGKTLSVDYSSPRMKGRKIFGALVPYNEVWRAGANEATTFVTNTNVNVEARTSRLEATRFSRSPAPINGR